MSFADTAATLALVSGVTEVDGAAQEPFLVNPEMALKLDDFAAFEAS